MPLTDREQNEALDRAAAVVQPLMPSWCEVAPRPGGVLGVVVYLHGAANVLGREVHVRFGERGLERYAAMNSEHRHVADARLRGALEKSMRSYDDGHAARKGVKLEPLVIDVGDVLAAD